MLTGLAARAAPSAPTAGTRSAAGNVAAVQAWIDKNQRLWSQIAPKDFSLETGPDVGLPQGGMSAGLGQMLRTAKLADKITSSLIPNSPLKLLIRTRGITQSETSVAWCGTNAVVGYNDSATFNASFQLPGNTSWSMSFDGFATSTDGGKTFASVSSLLPDPLEPLIQPGIRLWHRNLFGDPVLGCTNPSTFYYSSLALDIGFDSNGTYYYPGITVSISKTFAKNAAAAFRRRVLRDHFS
jgi:hypothetical protein